MSLNNTANWMIDRLEKNACEKYSYLECSNLEQLTEVMLSYGMIEQLNELREVQRMIVAKFN